MGVIFITTSSTPNLPGESDALGPTDLLCTTCGSAKALIIQAIGTSIPAASGRVSIEYTCSACGSIFGHCATVQQVATLLNAGATTTGDANSGRHVKTSAGVRIG